MVLSNWEACISVLALVPKESHNPRLMLISSQITIFWLPSIQLGNRDAKNDPGVQEYEDMLSNFEESKESDQTSGNPRYLTVLPRHFTESEKSQQHS